MPEPYYMEMGSPLSGKSRVLSSSEHSFTNLNYQYFTISDVANLYLIFERNTSIYGTIPLGSPNNP